MGTGVLEEEHLRFHLSHSFTRFTVAQSKLSLAQEKNNVKTRNDPSVHFRSRFAFANRSAHLIGILCQSVFQVFLLGCLPPCRHLKLFPTR